VSSQISDRLRCAPDRLRTGPSACTASCAARIHHLSVRGASPGHLLVAPLPATEHALRKAGLTIDDIDLAEVNEAFASVVLAWEEAHPVPIRPG